MAVKPARGSEMTTYPFPFRLSKPCSNCPFAKGNGSVEQMLEAHISGMEPKNAS